MERLFQCFDELDDSIIATALRLQRMLSRQPPERRKVPRTIEIALNPTSSYCLPEQPPRAKAAICKTG
jgi:hypothetical protein